jgi:hypothetical protein
VATKTWTCERCGVTASFAKGTEVPDIPKGWAKQNGHTYCLACRREMAGEAAVAAAGEGTAEDERQASAAGRIEFEIQRDPEQDDSRIAKSCRTSVAAVRKARERLGMHPSRSS